MVWFDFDIYGTNVLLIGLILFVTILVFRFSRRPNGLPPGPTPLPFLGNLLLIGNEAPKSFTRMSKKYGPIFSIDFASFPGVVINTPQSIRKCFSQSAFSGRPKFKVLEESRGGKSRGIAMAELNHWMEQRRFVLKNLRDFGFGRKSMEQSTQEGLQEVIETCRKSKGTPITTKLIFNLAVLNSLWKMICGEELAQDDPKVKELLQLTTEAAETVDAAGACFFFPRIASIFPGITGYNAVVHFQVEIAKFIDKVTADIKSTFLPQHKRHLVDAYLKEIADTKDPDSSFYGDEAIINMNATVLDLFMAGAETTSTTLTWAFLILAMHPDIQEKLQFEIDEVIGNSRLPTLEDKLKMPYTECFMMEVMRYGSVFPVGIWHKTTKNVEFEGYKIPKDTLVCPNLYGIMHDSKIWVDPQIIRPERFLLPDGNVDRQNEAWMPFSTGKRECPGAGLAKNEIFMFITGLCQQFKFELDPTQRIPELESSLKSMIRGPNPHRLIIKERKQN